MAPLQVAAGLAVLAGLLTATAKNQVAGMFSGSICVANGSIASVRTGYISVVSSLAAAVFEVGLDATDYRLDREHHPHLHGLALANTWRRVDGSWPDNADRIRTCGNCRRAGCNAPALTAGSISTLNGPGGTSLATRDF
jgi:hypothetical protein